MFKSLAGEPDPRGGPQPGQAYAAELPLNNFGSEAELAKRVLERLDEHFVIVQEVGGTHCLGRRMRADAVIIPRNWQEWKNPNIAFGVEFKLPDGSIRSYTKWLAQTVDYTHVDWDDFGHLVMLTCPGVAAGLCRDQGDGDPDTIREVKFAKRIIGQLNVGELVVRWRYGLTILINNDHVWSERSGVVRGGQWPLNVKSGSRN